MTDGASRVHSKCNFQFHEKAVWVNWGTSLLFYSSRSKKNECVQYIKSAIHQQQQKRIYALLTSLRSSLYVRIAILYFADRDVNGATEHQCALTWSAARAAHSKIVLFAGESGRWVLRKYTLSERMRAPMLLSHCECKQVCKSIINQLMNVRHGGCGGGWLVGSLSHTHSRRHWTGPMPVFNDARAHSHAHARRRAF